VPRIDIYRPRFDTLQTTFWYPWKGINSWFLDGLVQCGK